MNIAILGTGQVAQTIGTALVKLGHQVTLGSRTEHNENGVAWAEANGGQTHNFATAAKEAELVFNCTAGMHSLSVVQQTGAENLAGKVLIDVANPLDFSQGFPPTLSVCNDQSLAEQIQQALPDTLVVKALNTVANPVMVEPSRVPCQHSLPICGNDDRAKEVVKELLQQLGWQNDQILDLGDITNARGTEMYLALWVRLYGALGTGDFNIQIQKAD